MLQYNIKLYSEIYININNILKLLEGMFLLGGKKICEKFMDF